ncbi:type II restriction enzyme [Dolosigranulum savutiense]|uniref:Type II restriction endonuclease n=1 Tax=Dolosigranulum savutiense TaxID=3110288 RepID=A0AB74U3I7_9LACT
MVKLNINDAWEKILKEYDVLDKIYSKGFFNITAQQIKEFKEPRLMAKFDSSESLPSILKKHKINILPTSRGSYILSDFELYKKLPELTERVTKMKKVEIPKFETIDKKNINSESNAINVLMLSNLLDDFLNEDNLSSTFGGRMGTDKFDFFVNRSSNNPLNVYVEKAQCEIDAGMESANSVVILEAKNVVHPDFHVRQLYYPYRLWEKKVTKPIRLVFSIYTNQIFRLLEYKFNELNNYSSIQLVREKNYSLYDTEINKNDLGRVYKRTKVKTDDNQVKANVPFIQADSFDRVISLLEILQNNDETSESIAEIMQFDKRQSDYYYNAGKYLGLFKKIYLTDESDRKIVGIKLTSLGKEVVEMEYKDRQLKLVGLILEHKIFNDLFNEFFDKFYNTGQLPDFDEEHIKDKMRKYNVCNDRVIKRRSRSVQAWIKWIFSLTKIEMV